MKKLFVILLLFAAGSFVGLESCSKSAYFDAIVVADGDENVDGCGWLLNIDGNIFFPAGLKEEFKFDGAKITIQYTVSATTYKCINNVEYPVASITRYL